MSSTDKYKCLSSLNRFWKSHPFIYTTNSHISHFDLSLIAIIICSIPLFQKLYDYEWRYFWVVNSCVFCIITLSLSLPQSFFVSLFQSLKSQLASLIVSFTAEECQAMLFLGKRQLFWHNKSQTVFSIFFFEYVRSRARRNSTWTVNTKVIHDSSNV